MALETGTFIDDLVSTNPVSATDLVRYGADHVRLLKTTIKNSFAGAGGAVLVAAADSGTLNSVILTPTPALTEYTTRMIVVWHQSLTSTSTTPTMNISGLGAKTIVSSTGAALLGGDLVANRVYVGIYDGTYIQLQAVTQNYVDQLAFNSALPSTPSTSLIQLLRGANSSASWAGLPLQRFARTSNTILGVADGGTFIDITSGTFTQTFTACSTLGDGWCVFIRNAGTGDITLDPNSSETIDGLTSFIMYPNETRLIQCDGSNLRSIVLQPFSKTFTASGTFTKPPGYMAFAGYLWGAGASGGKQNAASNKPGGGGGACAPIYYLTSALSATESVVIGAGGTSVSADPSNGVAGGDSTFKGITAYGGAAPGYASTTCLGGSSIYSGIGHSNSHVIGAAPTSGTLGVTEYGGATSITTTDISRTIFGGGCGGSIDSADTLRNSTTTTYGGAGGASSLASSGADGTAPGGGGGSTKSGAQSGAGARGELRIWGIV